MIILKGIIFAAEGFEDLEVFYPLHRLKEEGIDVKIASMEKGKVFGKHGYPVNVDIAFSEVIPEEYDILVISGGKGPEKMRLDLDALKIVTSFFENNKPVAAICHGPQLLISAGVIKGRRATSYIGIRDDLIAAGAVFEDKEVVIDKNLVTSRHPNDLFAFGKEMIGLIKK